MTISFSLGLQKMTIMLKCFKQGYQGILTIHKLGPSLKYSVGGNRPNILAIREVGNNLICQIFYPTFWE